MVLTELCLSHSVASFTFTIYHSFSKNGFLSIFLFLCSFTMELRIIFTSCIIKLFFIFLCAEIILDLAREGSSAAGTGLVCVLAFSPVYPLHPAQTCHCCLCEEMEF